MKKLVKKAISEVYYNLYYKYKKNVGNRIILYHSIGSKLSHDIYGIAISKYMFIEHMKYIKDRYEIIPINENYKDNLNKNTLSLTFDDGYKDNLIALEICEKLEIPFTLYISTDFIGKNQYLDKNEIKLFENSKLCRVGSHGASHRKLATLSFEGQYQELQDSKNKLEDILGKQVIEMSYPHGSYNYNTMKIIDSLGYNIISSSHIGLNTVENLDFKRLKRIEIVANDSLNDLNNKILGYYDYLSIRE